MDALKIKLIILGDFCVGKSAIIKRKCENVYDTQYTTTIGVDFFNFTTIIDNKKVKVFIWDTAGQEKFKTIVKSYYNGTNGVLLVYDITNRKSFNNLDKWANDLKESGFEGKIMIIGNKCDDERNRVVDKSEVINYCIRNDYQFMECSSKENINIDDIFKRFTDTVYYHLDSINKYDAYDSFKLEKKAQKACCVIL
tara:strand:+ start:10205 stop:10792 length:588 start_codon:yes stop_codon:yes gene_type:complete